jgi:hypothetical protein
MKIPRVGKILSILIWSNGMPKICLANKVENLYLCSTMCHQVKAHLQLSTLMATANQHPLAHHPLDACYYSIVDEPQLS